MLKIAAQESVSVLLVEDDTALREALQITLELEGISFKSVGSAEEAERVLIAEYPQVLVSDIRLPGISGLDLLRNARDHYAELPVVLMTAFAETETAVEALRRGARDLLLKPFRPEQFIDVVRRYLKASGYVGPVDGPVAVDIASRRLLQKIERVAHTDTTVLITGESGSGKEVMAQYLHRKSSRQAGPFVAINCAAIPSTLLESILFGHEKGSFTGATKSQPGKFELANSGTIFLDEIGEMPIELQSKLLRVLQEREVERVGSHQTTTLDVRVITATNQDLGRRVAEGNFREDLYYRINVFPLRIPPLRERPGDILALAERFLLKYRASMGLAEARLSEESRRYLLLHTWPGNARELENAIQRGLLLCDGFLINPQDLDLESNALSSNRSPSRTDRLVDGDVFKSGSSDFASSSTSEGSMERRASSSASQMPSEVAQTGLTPTPVSSSLPAEKSANENVRLVQQEHILGVLRKVGGNRRKAVEILGISERTLRYKLKLWRDSGVEIP